MKTKVIIREPIATWWRIERYRAAITPVLVVHFTGSFVTHLVKRWVMAGDNLLVENRERRDDIFPSFAEAKEEAVRRARENVESCQFKLQEGRSFLGILESLKDPTVEARKVNVL